MTNHTHRIKRSDGAEILVDAIDADLVREYSWSPGGTNKRYAAAFIQQGNSVSTVYLHRLVMGAGAGQVVDHVDGNGLNCRRDNLRIVTKSENGANRSFTRNRTGFRNVSFSPKRNRYQARVGKQGGVFRGPYRSTAEEAAKDADAILRGLFPRGVAMNFPQDGEQGISRAGAS